MKNNSGKVTLAVVLTVFAVLLGVFSYNTSSISASNNNNNNNVTICHKNNGNGWSKITVDDDAVNGQGGGDHNSSQHQNGQDIIPAGYWDWNGRNWDSTGQAIWNNNCNVPTSTPTASPVPTSTATSQPSYSPTATPTTVPSVTPEPTDDPCEYDENERCVEPTSTPEATATPNNGDVCANIDGIQTSLPDDSYHFDVTGKNCLQFSVPGVETPSNPGTTPQVLGASTGRVLGASTMAGTGAVEDALFNSIFTLGSLLTSFGIMKNGKKRA